MNNPRCCGIDSVFVEISHSSKYWYCRECKKEVDIGDNNLSAEDIARINNTPLEEVKESYGCTAPKTTVVIAGHPIEAGAILSLNSDGTSVWSKNSPRPGSEPYRRPSGLCDDLVIPENLKLKKTTIKYIDVVLKSGNKMYSHRLDVTPEMARVLLEKLPINIHDEYAYSTEKIPPVNEIRSECLVPGFHAYEFRAGYIHTALISHPDTLHIDNYQWVHIDEPSYLVGNSNDTIRVVKW